MIDLTRLDSPPSNPYEGQMAEMRQQIEYYRQVLIAIRDHSDDTAIIALASNVLSGVDVSLAFIVFPGRIREQ